MPKASPIASAGPESQMLRRGALTCFTSRPCAFAYSETAAISCGSAPKAAANSSRVMYRRWAIGCRPSSTAEGSGVWERGRMITVTSTDS